CSTAWGCKSPAQPDGGEVLEDHRERVRKGDRLADIRSIRGSLGRACRLGVGRTLGEILGKGLGMSLPCDYNTVSGATWSNRQFSNILQHGLPMSATWPKR